MSIRILVGCATCVALTAFGEFRGGPDAASGQVVQLPTFHATGVATTVSIPDRGSTLMGGVGSHRSGAVSRGTPGLSHLPVANRLFGNRAIGAEVESGTISASAWIHDLRGMDEALLTSARAAQADRRIDEPADSRSPIDRRADRLTRGVGRGLYASGSAASDASTAGASSSSVAEIRRQNEAAVEAQNAEARKLLEQGRQAELSGQAGAARVFYAMAQRRATGQLKSELAARLAAVPR